MQLDLTGSFKVQELEVKFKPHRKTSPFQLNSAEDVYRLVRPLIADEPREKLIGLYLNTQHHLVALETISKGTDSFSVVSPREVFKTAFLTNANALILVHNHPSGKVDPSNEDIQTSLRLKDAAKLLDIELLDFIILSYTTYGSFAASQPEFVLELENQRKEVSHARR